MKIKKIMLQKVGIFDQETIELRRSVASKDKKAAIHVFVGQNGSGKTTILHALASAYDAFNPQLHQAYTNNLFYKKFQFFEKISDNYRSQVQITYENDIQTTIYGCPICGSIHKIEPQDASIALYGQCVGMNLKSNRTFEFAAFAYSGYRFVKAVDIDAIRENKENPLYQSLTFVREAQMANSFTINQWIANQISIAALEQVQQNGRKLKSSANPVAILSKILSEIIGEPIDFELKTNPIQLVMKMNHQALDFDVLPDGLRSMMSWIADLLMRLDGLKWKNDIPLFERNIILFLDEIEVHLHPHWQRKVLPVIQKLFKNAQVFVTTHSPFIANSVENAWIYELVVTNGRSKVAHIKASASNQSYQYLFRTLFGIEESYGLETQNELNKFYKLRDAIIEATPAANEQVFLNTARHLAASSEEIKYIIQAEMKQLARITAKNYVL
jgi:predicted ATP-binding protein involved in virulence